MTDDQILARAAEILRARLREPGKAITSPGIAKDYLKLTIGQLEHEVFVVMFLDSQNRIIAAEEMFRGTVNCTSVYPREVVKTALRHNAAAVMLAHNHPSGTVTPSTADEHLTRTLDSALKLVEVRVLDHFVVGAQECYSFAENGLL